MSADARVNLPIAITLGDAAGIGPEIIAKAFRDAPGALRGCFVAGDVGTMRRAAAIVAAVDAGEAGLIVPILVGPEARIRAAAEDAGKDISAYRIVPAPHSHAAAAAAVALVRSGEAGLLMKGSLHTDELMAAVVSSTTGLRTERRISHAYLMDVPDHPTPLIRHHRRYAAEVRGTPHGRSAQ